jgi:hypothetical protein
MDRDEALRLLKGGSEGVAEWNRRRKVGEEIPPLREADLRGANLIRADLRGAVLVDADLRGADLRGALGLAQGQLEWARGDGETKLPEGLVRPESRGEAAAE